MTKRDAEQMTRAEFDRHLAAAVRRGSVTAMKLYADLYLRGDANTEADPVAEIIAMGTKRPSAKRP